MTEKRMAPGKDAVPFDLRDRTFLFTVHVIKWVRLLPNDTGTQVVGRQLCRSSSSIGANVEEADGTDTPKDRVYKWVLARKEARESRYWIRVVCAIGSDSPEGQALAQEAQELINILSALINKGKRNLGAT
ncbi:MAG: four helix bundle protein [Anaerolineales bacterium]|nr:four helix bundle protein [Anaerolineales bacterium]